MAPFLIPENCAAVSIRCSSVAPSVPITAEAWRKGPQQLFNARFKNKKSPALPNGMVWYLHEPTWQAVATGRLEFGMQEFSLNVVYEDDFGVNAGLKVRAQKAGLELGGSFEDHMAKASEEAASASVQASVLTACNSALLARL